MPSLCFIPPPHIALCQKRIQDIPPDFSSTNALAVDTSCPVISGGVCIIKGVDAALSILRQESVPTVSRADFPKITTY